MSTSREGLLSGLLHQLEANKASLPDSLSTLHALEGATRSGLDSAETTDPRLQPTLVSLVQQRSPLLSYAARRVIECVLSSSFLEEPEAAAWMTALLDLPDHGDRATSVNTLECCAAILSSWREERHPELIKEGRVGDAGPSAEVVTGAVAAAWKALPRIIRREVERAVSGDQLPVTWAVKLVRALSQQEATPPGGGGGVWAEVLGSWPQLSGRWEARRQVVLLALELLRQEGLPPPLLHELLRAMQPVLMDDEQAEGEEEEAVECSFLRPTSASDLLPFRLALTCKALARGLSCARPEQEGTPVPLIQLVLNSPLSLRYLRTAPDHSGLIECLSEQDDVLFEALNDWLVFVARARQQEDMAAAEQQGDPLSMLSCLVGSLGADEQVLLDMMLSSDDAGILEYLIRVTKYMTWRFANGRGQCALEEGEREAVLCVLRLGARVEGLCGKGLFPYDARPWLNRVAECRAAWQALEQTQGT